MDRNIGNSHTGPMSRSFHQPVWWALSFRVLLAIEGKRLKKMTRFPRHVFLLSHTRFVLAWGVLGDFSMGVSRPVLQIHFEFAYFSFFLTHLELKQQIRSYTPVVPSKTIPDEQNLYPFSDQNGYRLCPFWSGIGYGFRGNYGSVWTYVWFQLQMTKNEREIQEFEMDFKKSFLLPF